MPLVTCPDCQSEVSDRATACPKCGYPIGGAGEPRRAGRQRRRKKRKGASFGLGCLFLIVVVAGVGILMDNKPSRPPSGSRLASTPAPQTPQSPKPASPPPAAIPIDWPDVGREIASRVFEAGLVNESRCPAQSRDLVQSAVFARCGDTASIVTYRRDVDALLDGRALGKAIILHQHVGTWESDGAGGFMRTDVIVAISDSKANSPAVLVNGCAGDGSCIVAIVPRQ